MLEINNNEEKRGKDSPMKTYQEDNFYIKNKEEFMKSYLNFVNNPNVSKVVLLNQIDQTTFETIIEEWTQELELLLPHIPYIGGNKNRMMTFFLTGAVLWLGFYRVLKRRGSETREIGGMIYEMVEKYYESLPKIRKKIMRWYYYSKLAQYRFKKSCKKRAQWQYPGDYQSVIVEGEAQGFNWGFDYTECGAVKFLKNQNALDLVPYLCISDYAMFRALVVGFKRTKTIGMGGDTCDFRFFKDHKTQKGWPPDELEEFKYQQNKKEKGVQNE